ncbi:hypothetical protein GE061_016669 [Apolygus lucorum]|uniref:Dynein regulatory complex protein 1/2 N-terminal domain-containing protein n=1 Tax=Apolygus lucorum TaxID=248454 RepID=A0A8S9XGY3_APOLU|nr:hypothetical protein GE061_016669 [Apolygus lucorum]
MHSPSNQKHKPAVRVLQKNQVSLKETECTVDDLKEVRTSQLGVDEGVLRELLRLGLDNEDKIESFFIADDPEIRKAARRIKIERRIQQAENIPQDGQEPVKIPTDSELQMESSMYRILELLEDSRRSISAMRVTTVQNALERQKKEKEQRDEIEKIIKEECEKAQAMYDEIDRRWKEISQTEDILTLYDKTEDQKDSCLELLEQKDIFIANLKMKLKQADRQFNEELAKQDDFMVILTERINDQINVMNDCYQRELHNLQNVVNVEKNEVLSERKKQWEKMSGNKERLELENMVKRYDYLQEYEEQIDSMIIEQHETMRDQKMIMETKLNKLTVEENRYQSAVLISKELLNYNVQVLQKRQDENRVIKGQQKRIVNRLQDSVRKLRQEQKDEIQRLVNEKKQLQDSIKNLHGNVNTLNVRLKTLAASSTKKYFKLWDFNQGVAEELIDKVRY